MIARTGILAGAVVGTAVGFAPAASAHAPVTPQANYSTPLWSSSGAAVTTIPAPTAATSSPTTAPVAYSTSTTSNVGAAVVAAAAREAGKRYVFGTAGPNTFDCSGYTQYVYKQFGVNLPHLANAQKNYGRAVSKADMRPGDLLVFLSGGYGYHVAIYAGNGKMWEAANSSTPVGLHTIWSNSYVVRRLVG